MPTTPDVTVQPLGRHIANYLQRLGMAYFFETAPVQFNSTKYVLIFIECYYPPDLLLAQSYAK